MATNNNSELVVFILTHGRPDHVYTWNTLRNQGYTGRILLILDNQDTSVDRYKEKYGEENIVIFDKLATARETDSGDTTGEMRTILYVRNACFEIARERGIEYFFEFDDDYREFVYKFNDKLFYCEKKIKNLDRLFASMLAFYKSIPALTIALAQNGDFIGGKNNRGMGGVLTPKRKCMNTFLCSPSRPFKFFGRHNEDVNTYVGLGNRGHLLFTIPNVAVIQTQTQVRAGGLTELYRQEGTYIKSFFSLMYCPSAVSIGTIGYRQKRIHHRVSWNNAVPCILNERYKAVRS
jgi:hypothetical protein